MDFLSSVRRRYPARPIVLTLMLISSTLAACGHDNISSEAEPAVTIRDVGDMEAFALPLDPYRISRTTQGLYNKAFGVMYRTCMKRFGFDLVAPDDSSKSAAENGRRYGISSREYSQQHGYHLQEKVSRVNEQRHQRQPSTAELAVANGGGKTQNGQQVPVGGCIGEAHQKVDANVPKVKDERLGDMLSIQAYNSSKSDSRVVSAFKKWSECMKRSGYNYSDPIAAVNDPAFGGAEPSAAEIQTAVTDITCKRDANLLNVWGSVETAYQQRALDQNAEALAQLREYLRIRDENARKLLTTAAQ